MLFSIIIPVYNAEHVLERCVNSVLNQTVEDFELLLIDDGSTDSSGVICDRFAEKDQRVRVFHKKNGGVSSARNIGLDNVIGKYIVFVDSDDYIDIEYLEHFEVDRFNHDILITGYYVENELSELICSRQFDVKEYQTREDFCDAYVIGRFNYVWGKAIKREVIIQSNAKFDETISLSEDTLFVIDLLTHVRKVRVSNCVDYHYIKYKRETLTNLKSKEEYINRIDNANEVINAQFCLSVGKQAEKYTISRIGALYKVLINEIVSSDNIDKSVLKNLFSKKWFRKTLDYADEIYCDESAKFRALLKTKSYLLVYTYLKHFR